MWSNIILGASERVGFLAVVGGDEINISSVLLNEAELTSVLLNEADCLP